MLDCVKIPWIVWYNGYESKDFTKTLIIFVKFWDGSSGITCIVFVFC